MMQKYLPLWRPQYFVCGNQQEEFKDSRKVMLDITQARMKEEVRAVVNPEGRKGLRKAMSSLAETCEHDFRSTCFVFVHR